MLDVSSFAAGRWIGPGADARPIESAITGAQIARAGGAPLDSAAMLAYARDRGGPALRQMSFHDRARLLKALALYLQDRREALYELSYDTGATAKDHLFDIDGGIGTMFVYASKGRREMPDDTVLVDGAVEQLSRDGSFLGQHVWTPLRGVAVHVNAYNFPVWGMLEKFAPALLAGVPSIVKPATATSYVTEACVRMILEAGLLPEGALQMVAGGLGNMLDHLGPQDAVTFTGSAETALKLRSHGELLRAGVRFTAEQDSLNASILGPDAAPGTPEFDLFVKEAHREMTTKAGQKCTAIRRILAPATHLDALTEALSARLAKTTVGDPRQADVRMGALVSGAQKADVLAKVETLRSETALAFGSVTQPLGKGVAGGAFVAPTLLRCDDPDAARAVHGVEAFGPVSTLMPYRDLDHAVAIANRGGGSLVASVITHDPEVARRVVEVAGAWHGRLYFNDRDAMAESTGHGAPMPHMVHGGPGRAGGGEELGGIRGVTHFMQRTAVQGSPAHLAAVTGRWVPGAPRTPAKTHPFRLRYDDLTPGLSLTTDAREVTLEDLETFAHFTGDTFYAHMDEAAARRNPFFPGRVAHGYLLLSFAAGLFVEPAEGPVLANTGLDALRFLKPVVPGTRIRVELTVMARHPRVPEYGEVRWHARVLDAENAEVATYELLTMVARADA
ncbi:phenylacetic acid degradation bifunctional protein PaaZ [Jannaschia marina]|uniref:phenylacetic acid degradation bifunctional protein PaaZ n=1 Tax=Jannaschia marina TaxID=2741674 RepID=UPI0015C9AD4A|nr:phenylacetic acid degradation bifunctional protein PaaZ [Jannaschia marina]